MSIANTIANIVMVLGFSGFLVFLFGRENSLIHKLGRANVLSVKVLLSLCASASLYNAVASHEATPSELLLNISVALLFCWASVFHYFRFVQPLVEKTAKKKRAVK